MPTAHIFTVRRPRSWEGARRILLRIASAGQEILFRGQANAKWTLQSSFGRKMDELAEASWLPEGNRQKEEDRYYAALLKAFAEASRRIPGAENPENEDELEALAQHYGLPTRLLDWSRSPYIAAFFAFDGCGRSIFPRRRKVAVWALDWNAHQLATYFSYKGVQPSGGDDDTPHDLDQLLGWLRSSNNIWPVLRKVEIKGNANRRLIYQEGLFSRPYKVPDDVERHVREGLAGYSRRTVLWKIEISGKVQAEALRDLSLMTISPVALMSDLEGAAGTAFNREVRFRPPWSPS